MLKPEFSTGRPDPEVFISSPLESPQYMVTVYRDSHGTTRTVATREVIGDRWSAEHILLPEGLRP